MPSLVPSLWFPLTTLAWPPSPNSVSGIAACPRGPLCLDLWQPGFGSCWSEEFPGASSAYNFNFIHTALLDHRLGPGQSRARAGPEPDVGSRQQRRKR